MSSLLRKFALIASGCLYTVPVCAMDIQTELIDLRPISEPAVHVTMRGPIVPGDVEKLSKALIPYDKSGVRDFLFLLDSPGGNLFEGMSIGRLISRRTEITTGQVGSGSMPDAICASACVYVLLGTDYRYLAERGRIGVHRFRIDDPDLDSATALSTAQELSALVLAYIVEMRASPALFERMSKTASIGIDWISRRDLESWRVVTGPIYSEELQYRNISGKIALEFSQMSRNGDSNLLLACGDLGLFGITTLREPRHPAIGGFQIVIDGDTFSVPEWELLSRENGYTKVAFTMPTGLKSRLVAAQSFGARIVVPSGDLFYGFEQTIRDEKLEEMVLGCAGPASRAPVPMTLYPDTDFVGNDLTKSGFRGISFAECERICLAEPFCAAVSYVESKSWCWPKSVVGRREKKQGILSAVKK